MTLTIDMTMNSHRTTPIGWRLRLVGAAICSLCSALGAAAQPAPGEPYVIDVAAAHGPVQLETRYVPPGQGVSDEPPTEPLPPEKAEEGPRMNGFYLGACEISQKELLAVLGQEVLDGIRARSKFGETTETPASPAAGVSIAEAIEFCRELERLIQEKGDAQEASLESMQVRLPSIDEWRYACRGIAVPAEAIELPHFNRWPNLEAMPKDVLRDCEKFWSDSKSSEAFVGTQIQVMRIVEEIEPAQRGVAILSAFLGEAVGAPREKEYGTTSEIRPANSGAVNGWGLKNMHENVAEWAIAIGTSANSNANLAASLTGKPASAGDQAVTSRDAPATTWTSLVSGEDALKKGRFSLVGGAFNDAVNESDRTKWRRFSISAIAELSVDELRIHSVSDGDRIAWPVDVADKLVSDRLPGFRILLDRTLSEDWLYLVRRDSTLAEPRPTADTERTFASYRESIAGLASDDDLTDANRRLDFLQTLEGYRQEGAAAVTSRTQTTVDATDPESLFVQTQLRLMASDSSLTSAH